MTTAYNDTSTERVPGRAWTIRLTGHADRTAAVTCSTAACRMPPRSKDIAALRAFAAQHAAAHARAATVRPHAYCHCGSQRCAAHPGTPTHCAGTVVLILRHDPTVGRVWSVEEVCAACAPLIPHVTVLARAAARPPRTTDKPPAPRTPAPTPASASAGQAVPGGFSSPATTSFSDGDEARPARRPGRALRPARRRRPGRA
ncbi:hypothetical protein JCM4814A_94510 [Streptomyces phaeofaciens JCM 4814]|uniref:Uncharacterized protein n=1 Tax=Streptomyces phaeofaciens TaxID=68254 RepID=A0A918HQU0_9ACTN|nr:hypothetical protein [Streptomyces phaeofaciens]GGT97195.1 hypothetical protein GCM10010226_88250 [Streptomyces phaeofaciens]